MDGKISDIVNNTRYLRSVYDKELLKKIRENAFAYIHGREVGGTNPSLLEALASINMNLIFDVAYKPRGRRGCNYLLDQGMRQPRSHLRQS